MPHLTRSCHFADSYINYNYKYTLIRLIYCWTLWLDKHAGREGGLDKGLIPAAVHQYLSIIKMYVRTTGTNLYFRTKAYASSIPGRALIAFCFLKTYVH